MRGTEGLVTRHQTVIPDFGICAEKGNICIKTLEEVGKALKNKTHLCFFLYSFSCPVTITV